MQCSVCGEQLPSGASACPRCGSFVSYGTGATLYNPTVMSTGNIPPGTGQPVSSQIPTAYGSNPYGVPSPSNPYPYTAPNPYAPSDPYTLPNTPYNVQQQTPLPPPPMQYQRPPQQRQKGPNIGLIVGLVVLAVIVVAGGLFAFSRFTSSSGGGLTQAQINATATAHAGNGNTSTNGTNPYPPHTGTLVLNDPMVDNSKGYKWDEATMSGAGSCGFSGGAYHIITTKPNTSIICNPEASSLVFSNLTFEARLTIITGDAAGIVIRVDQQKQTDYIFAVDTQGNYYLYSDDGPNAQFKVLRQGSNGAILKGLNQTNLLAVVANGSSFYLYVNGVYIDQGTDGKYSQGQIGVYGSAQGTCNVVASNARVWKM